MAAVSVCQCSGSQRPVGRQMWERLFLLQRNIFSQIYNIDTFKSLLTVELIFSSENSTVSYFVCFF